MEEGLEAKAKKRRKRRLLLMATTFLVLLVVGGAASITLRTKSPVPAHVAKSVNYHIYYPNPKALPAGFVLDKKSFKYVSGQGVLYTVSYGTHKRLVFTVQEKPSDSELSSFNKLYLPINRKILAPAGTATEGAIGKQTVVSLPVDADKVWIIMTGPPDIYATDNLAQILKAIQK